MTQHDNDGMLGPTPEAGKRPDITPFHDIACDDCDSTDGVECCEWCEGQQCAAHRHAPPQCCAPDPSPPAAGRYERKTTDAQRIALSETMGGAWISNRDFTKNGFTVGDVLADLSAAESEIARLRGDYERVCAKLDKSVDHLRLVELASEAETTRLRGERDEHKAYREKAEYSARQFCGAHVGMPQGRCPVCSRDDLRADATRFQQQANALRSSLAAAVAALDWALTYAKPSDAWSWPTFGPIKDKHMATLASLRAEREQEQGVGSSTAEHGGRAATFTAAGLTDERSTRSQHSTSQPSPPSGVDREKEHHAQEIETQATNEGTDAARPFTRDEEATRGSGSTTARESEPPAPGVHAVGPPSGVDEIVREIGQAFAALEIAQLGDGPATREHQRVYSALSKHWPAIRAALQSHAFECKARKPGAAGADPIDCDWPRCGCDPYADKVVEALDEEAALSPRALQAIGAEPANVVSCAQLVLDELDALWPNMLFKYPSLGNRASDLRAALQFPARSGGDANG